MTSRESGGDGRDTRLQLPDLLRVLAQHVAYPEEDGGDEVHHGENLVGLVRIKHRRVHDSGAGGGGGEHEPGGRLVEVALDHVDQHAREDNCGEQVAVGQRIQAGEKEA